MRIGGFCASMVRICTGEVCVRSSLRSPSGVGLQEERVVHLARRMAFGEVQRGEIVVVGLDVRTFGDREAHVAEDRGDLVDHLADRMDAAALGRRLAHRQRHVDRLGGEPRGDRRVLAVRRWRAASASVTRFFSPLIAGPLVWRSSGDHRAQRLQQLGDRALLAERGDAHGLDRRLRRRPRRCRPAASASSVSDLRSSAVMSISVLDAMRRRDKEKPAPALPARVSQIEFRKLGKALA